MKPLIVGLTFLVSIFAQAQEVPAFSFEKYRVESGDFIESGGYIYIATDSLYTL